MKRPHLARIVLVAAMSVVVFLAGSVGLFLHVDNQADTFAPPVPQTGALLAPGGQRGLGDSIASLQQRLRESPGDWRSAAALGLAYVQQARITADPSYYPKAEEVLQSSLRFNPDDNAAALVGAAALASARHDFTTAIRYGRRAKALNPYDANVHGVLGDALAEVGRYDRAIEAFQTMVDTRPDMASFARVSYARELSGDVSGAIRAMERARDFAASPSDEAWASYQLGELYFSTGRLSRARTAYVRGSRLDPSFVPSFSGLAKVAWAEGDLDAAVTRYTDVVSRFPAPEFVIALGDLYAVSGDRDASTRQYELVHAIGRLFRANGVNTDLELALFYADHDRPRAALRAARAEWRRRTGIAVADALGWALYANGEFDRAWRYAQEALELGTKNASFLFHAGMIQVARGKVSAGKRLLTQALDVNPHFSILRAAQAIETLEELKGTS